MTRRQIVLCRIPDGTPQPDDFAVVESTAGDRLRTGQVRVRTTLFGLNAGLRSRLGTGLSTTFGPPVSLGDTPRSDAIGTVVESASATIAVGDTVVGSLPWVTECITGDRDLAIVPATDDPVEYLTFLGHVGRTAWAGLVSVGRLQPGQTVWISAAAGGVGSCAVQVAERLGARVLASAGGSERTTFLRDILGVADVIDRRSGDLRENLRALAPDGIDLYFDAVGGDHLRIALELLRPRGTAVLVGRSGPRDHQAVLADTGDMIRRRLTIIGLSVTDHPEAAAELTSFVDKTRPLHAAATVTRGLDRLPDAFCALLAGEVLGRAVVDVRQTAAGQ